MRTTELRFVEKLEKNSTAHPENIALISAETGENMTYGELWEHSGRVYRFLKQKNIGKEDVVMIAVPRGINPIIALIGIWRAGAAAIMLEADYAPERMAYILQNADCVLKIDTDLLSRINMSCDSLEKSRPLLAEKAGLVIFGIERIYLAGNSEFWTVRDRVYDSASDFADDYIRTRQLLIYSNCNKFYCRRIIEDARLRFEEGVSFGEDRLFNYIYLRLLDRAGLHPAVITSFLVMLRYIQRDHLSQSSKMIPHFFRQAMRLHDAKKCCFFGLSKGCTEEEKLNFEAYDLSQEVRRAIERFRLHPEEREENLPEINQLVFGGPYDRDAPIDVLVILGSRNCAYKAEAAFEIGKRNPGLRYIVSGANPVQDKSCSEAEFLFSHLRKQGVDVSDIYLESRAHYTKQNLEFSSLIIRRLQEDGKLPGREGERLRVGFLTGGFHIPRASLIAEEITAEDDWEIRWFPAYGTHTRPESWFENPTGRDIILAELRKTHLLKNEVRGAF